MRTDSRRPGGGSGRGGDGGTGGAGATGPRRPHRDRRGRGMRGELAPPSVPRSISRGERFDDLVLDAIEELEQAWADELAGVEFAVEEVPPAPDQDAEFDPDVVVDRGVALGRLLRPHAAGEHAPTIVVYRRPVEARAGHGEDRADLIFLIVAELVAEFLGRDLDDIDPPGRG